MDQPIVTFENVSKLYHLGRTQGSLRESLARLPARLWGPACQEEGQERVLWALRDVSFQLHSARSLGLMGPNGAGKTTALKLIAGVTKPASGRITVRGRVGSLIELGAGFHPDLTGRENIFLNGVLLGLSRREIARKFDSIVDFSELARFLDTPVKRYSSGMYVRLGFAVAAHIEPDILLVDEVLAVGDINFRAKCYRKMAELRKLGTTVILVSHNEYAIRDTCDEALLVWKGNLICQGKAEEVISRYLMMMQEGSRTGEPQGKEDQASEARPSGPVSTKARITRVRFEDGDGLEGTTFPSGAKVIVTIEYASEAPVENPIFGLEFYDEGGFYGGCHTSYDQFSPGVLQRQGSIRLTIDSLAARPGTYMTSVILSEDYEYNILDCHHKTYPIRVVRAENSRGPVALPHSWEVVHPPTAENTL